MRLCEQFVKAPSWEREAARVLRSGFIWQTPAKAHGGVGAALFSPRTIIDQWPGGPRLSPQHHQL